MRWRLANEGFNVVPADKWQWDGQTRYDLISLLNLLDRHYSPFQLLAEVHELALQSNCPVLLGLVLPVSQYVEFHPSKTSVGPGLFSFSVMFRRVSPNTRAQVRRAADLRCL